MENKPKCLGFIMDGNRRWAKEQGMEAIDGHRQGQTVFMDFVRFIRDAKIPHAVFFAFSTENWGRPKSEIDQLMKLFDESSKKLGEGIDEEKVHVRIVGRRQDFSSEQQVKFREVEEKSQSNQSGTTIWVALSYGGRAEIVDAVNEAVKNGRTVTEAEFDKLLWTADMPDPDMIVRTSGEQRLSGFVTWRSVYSELYFINKHWPALTKTDFEDILIEYGKRERRRGS